MSMSDAVILLLRAYIAGSLALSSLEYSACDLDRWLLGSILAQCSSVGPLTLLLALVVDVSESEGLEWWYLLCSDCSPSALY